MEAPAKKQRLAGGAAAPREDDTGPAASGVIVRFESADGETLPGVDAIDLPQSTTTQQLDHLLNTLLKNEEKMSYSFFTDGNQIAEDLEKHLKAHKISVESTLTVVYQPQAVFHVRSVTRCTASMPGHAESVLAVQFSPDGKRLASGSGDHTVRLWDLNTQLPMREGKGHKGWVQCVSWSPDGAMLASGSVDGEVCLWDPKTGELKGRMRGHKKAIMGMAWEPAHLAWPCRRLATAGQDGSVRVWNAVRRQSEFVMSQHTRAVSCVRWGGDGLIYSASRDGSIKAWDGKDGKLCRNLQGHGHWVNTLALSSDYALRTGPHDHLGQRPESDAACQTQARERWEAATGGKPERLVSGSDDFTMFLWEPSTSKKPLARLTGHQQLINHVAFSPDGNWIASASFDKSVRLWNARTGAFVATLRGHVGAVYQLAWSADSRLLVSGSKDSTLKVWELRTRKVKSELPGHADEVFSVDWAPDGRTVASGGRDKVLKLWRY
ncbi:unnamed protein product [Pedinophyceae sp. YPF-701]|nr:unnamed protein product [Pedinophyceae sp. YPF-701]